MANDLVELHCAKASVEISTFGANITSWTIDGQPCLWLSDAAVLDGSSSIRGGIPVVFPVFGKGTTPPTSSLPQHGFARKSIWRVTEKTDAKATFELTPQDIAPDMANKWPYNFTLTLSMELSPASLDITANVINNGKEAFDFQFLLHAYFFVKDIRVVTVNGLHGCTYWDKNTGKTASESRETISIDAPTDRVYRDVENTVTIDISGRPVYRLVREGLPDVVTWNPWEAGSQQMSDYRPTDAYLQNLCVEPGFVHEFYNLPAGETKQFKLSMESV